MWPHTLEIIILYVFPPKSRQARKNRMQLIVAPNNLLLYFFTFQTYLQLILKPFLTMKQIESIDPILADGGGRHPLPIIIAHYSSQNHYVIDSIR